MQVRTDMFRWFGGKSTATARNRPVERRDTTSALAEVLAGDSEAVRLSLDLIAQIKAAGFASNDPRIESLPAAVALAARAARAGVLWD